MSSLIRGAPGAVTGIGVQSAKVQRPLLRPETLARFRLLDWLHVQIHHRILLVIAEAGYGKTTLLADFSGRTRLRTMWYRIEEDDRDWVTFLSHLVAAGRVHDPEFAATTAALLADTGVTAATLDTVLNTFIAELPPIAEHGAALILDDYHLVDDAPDIKLVVREIVARAPERLTIVFSSRRSPGVPLGKLRAGGEVAELRTDDLRFDRDETARLFAETYGRPLEPDILADLADRTEGWAASLQLVQAALRDRSPNEIRRMVRNLTGADHELYDYLAEEVVGDLSEELQQFLMRTSILQAITPELAAFVTDLTGDDVRSLITQAERVGLLSRRGETARDSLRYHPLVGDFLRARLERSVGEEGVSAAHRRLALAYEGRDWRLACHHFQAIGDHAGLARTIQGAVQQILSDGELDSAEGYMAEITSAPPHPAFDVIRSRMELRRGRPQHALERAKAAYEASPTSPVVLANLSSIAMMAGAYDLARETSLALTQQSIDTDMAAIGHSLTLLLAVTEDGSLSEALERLEELRRTQRTASQRRFEGITAINIGGIRQAMGDAEGVVRAANDALSLIGESGRDDEIAAGLLLRAWGHAHLGRLIEARADMAAATELENDFARAEALIESASIETWYGAADRAGTHLQSARLSLSAQGWLQQPFRAAEIQLALRNQDPDTALSLFEAIPTGPSFIVALKARLLVLQAEVAILREEPAGRELLEQAIAFAEAQGATHWRRYGEVLRWLTHDPTASHGEASPLADLGPYLSLHAETVTRNLSRIPEVAMPALLAEAETRRDRWLPTLRACLDTDGPDALAAAQILDVVGTQSDVVLLRQYARRSPKGHRAELGKALARRVAPRIVVEDQGRIAIRIGERLVEGTAIRRKVLALMCFLLTKPRFSAAREEALDALWPDSEPAVALNSLNQTVYFLRRVLEPGYSEDLSPGYVRHESDVLWLDRQLVSSRTQRCFDYINSLPPTPSPDQVAALVELYHAPFALDFAYEEWAQAYRDATHAGYLSVVERAIAMDMATGHFERGISIARRALQVDPDAEHLELSLLRLLRLTGAHAAAAEQYEHYATVLREQLGVEPPRLEDL